MHHRRRPYPRNNERGVTLLIVAVAMVSMLAMVALAVDVITLYAARSEAQRAADSAALAAAKMLVDSGVTADPGNAGLQATAKTAATQVAKDVATQISIAARQVQSGDVTATYGAANFGINPTVTVTVNRPNLPTFFSRIWSRAALSVSASATAEAFNPSNSASAGGFGAAGVPVVARCVKPFLLPNCDPLNANNLGSNCAANKARFFDPVSGAIVNAGAAPTGVIGETFNVSSNCAGPGPTCSTAGVLQPATAGQYYPAQMPAATLSCPAACGAGSFENEIGCCNPTPISCGTTATLPVVNQLSVDDIYPDGGGGAAQNGVQCLIHQVGGSGQDTLDGGMSPPGSALTYPLQIQVGSGNPARGASLSTNDFVTTSDSLVTVPIYEPPAGGAAPVGPVNIVGFLQVFIDRSFPGGGGPKAGSFDVTVVNVAGCGSNASGAPVFNGGPSAVPVRLIHQ
jgi:Flp pilus assembly protein TadG